jgi:hypothetical protein
MLKLIENAAADVVFISVVAPSTVLHARYLCLKLRAKFRNERIIVGLWGNTIGNDNSDSIRRVQDSGADSVVTTFADALTQMQALRKPMSELVPA